MNEDYVCELSLDPEELVLVHTLVSEPLKSRKMRRKLGDHIDLFQSLNKRLEVEIKRYEIFLKSTIGDN